MTQEEIDQAWDSFYKRDIPVSATEIIRWNDVKNLYNIEDEIEKTGEVFAMRGMLKFGFPLELE